MAFPDILHVVDYDPGRHMGPGRSVPSLCRAERRLGLDARMLNLRDRRVLVHGSEPGEPDYVSRPLDPRDVAAVMENSGLVHFNNFFHPPFVVLARQCRKGGVPYVVCPRGNLVRAALRTQRPVRKRLALAIAGRNFVLASRSLHFLTEAEARASERFGHPYLVAPNGVDAPPAAAVQPARPRSRRLTFIGRIDVRHKGLDRVLAFAERHGAVLREGGWSVRLHGPDHRGGRAWVASEIRRRGLEPLVDLADPVSGDAKHRALLETRLFFHASRFEGQPQAVLEAMAHAAPVAVSKETNFQDEVLDAGAGYAWERLEGPEAPSILRELEGEEALVRMGRAGRALMTSTYTWRAAAQRLLDALDRIRR